MNRSKKSWRKTSARVFVNNRNSLIKKPSDQRLIHECEHVAKKYNYTLKKECELDMKKSSFSPKNQSDPRSKHECEFDTRKRSYSPKNQSNPRSQKECELDIKKSSFSPKNQSNPRSKLECELDMKKSSFSPKNQSNPRSKPECELDTKKSSFSPKNQSDPRSKIECELDMKKSSFSPKNQSQRNVKKEYVFEDIAFNNVAAKVKTISSHDSHRLYPTHKACSFSPNKQDFATSPNATRNSPINMQSVLSPKTSDSKPDKYQKLLLEQYGFDPRDGVPGIVNQLKELVKKVVIDSTSNTENSTKLDKRNTHYPNLDKDCPTWHRVDNVEDLDVFLATEALDKQRSHNNTQLETKQYPKDVQVSNKPRVKLVAEKFVRFKKEDIEIRKKTEKIVCVEYDVFDVNDDSKPFQVMRAFFSLKSPNGGKDIIPFSAIPPDITRKYNITEGDLKQLNVEEIEIIDDKIPENQSCLKDLQKILKKNRSLNMKKNKSTLDLKSMYVMALRDSPTLDHDFSNTNLLSKAELDEVKQLISQHCTSNEISRKMVKEKPSKEFDVESSIFKELLLKY